MDENYFSNEDLDTVRKNFKLPNLEIYLRSTWGSQNSSHRQEIHNFLDEKKIQTRFPSDSSISHCRSLGGFAFCCFKNNQELQLGFDIEEDLRVTEEVAQRICKSPLEFSQAPSAASLWTAKEAAFKALKGPRQPRTVSEVELVDWKILNSQIETVQIKPEENFPFVQTLGVLIKQKPYTFAVFVSFF